MSAAEFSERARQAVYTRSDHRCAGCGRSSPLTVQHRRARGMGGSSSVVIGHPANGVALEGSGTTGCHGWVEHHPDDAALLGYRLTPGEDPLEAPYFDRLYGWRRVVEDGGHVFVDEPELDRLEERLAALGRYRAWLATRDLPPGARVFAGHAAIRASTLS
jgi:hypothetical protein